MSRSALAGTVTLIVVCVPVSISSGHIKFYKSKAKPSVTVQYTNQDPAVVPPGGGPPPPPPIDSIDFFSGQVTYTSRPGLCGQAPRTVKVRRDGDNAIIGEIAVADDGSWQLSAEDVPAGQYRAIVVQRKFKLTIPPVPGLGLGHIHKTKCRGALSDPVAAGP